SEDANGRLYPAIERRQKGNRLAVPKPSEVLPTPLIPEITGSIPSQESDAPLPASAPSPRSIAAGRMLGMLNEPEPEVRIAHLFFGDGLDSTGVDTSITPWQPGERPLIEGTTVAGK